MKIKNLIILLSAFLFTSIIFAQSPDILNTLHEEGTKFYNNAQYSQAIEKFKTGLEIARKNKDSRAVSVFIANLGIVYANLGDYKNVISCYEEALRIKNELNDRKGRALILTNMGNIYDELGNYDKAINCYKDALDIFREFKDQKGIQTNVANIGILYDKMGDYQKAILYYNESLKTAYQTGYKKGAMNILTNLGIAHEHMGDYTPALKYYDEALKIAAELNDKNALSDIYINTGLIYNNIGDHREAINQYEKALSIKTEIKDKKGLSNCYANLSLAYMNLSEHKKALSLCQKALKIKLETASPSEQIRANLADIYLETGDIKKAEKEYITLGDPIRLGRLALIKKDYAAAAKYFSDSVKDTLKNRNPRLFFAGYCGLGMAYLALKDYDRAKDSLEKAILYNEELRESLGQGEKSRFFTDKVHGFYRAQPYESMVELYINTGNLSKAFYYSENLKARILAETIVKNKNTVSKTLPAREAETEKQYNTSIHVLRRLMHTAYLNKETEIYNNLEQQLKEEKEKQKKFIGELRLSYPEYVSLNYPTPVKSDEVTLNKNEVLLEFEITEEKTFVFILKDGDLSVRDIEIPRKHLKKLVLDYRSYFENISNFKDLLDYKPQTGKELYQTLFEKLLSGLSNDTSIIIVPDEFLGILSFESLPLQIQARESLGESDYGPFPLGIKYLGDTYSISYAQSATSLTLLRAVPKEEYNDSKILVVCDPVFSENDSRAENIKTQNKDKFSIQKMSAIQKWQHMGLKGTKEKGIKTPESGGIFPRLEKTAEISKISKILFGKNSDTYSSLDAKEENIVILDFSKYKYLIFATHGILDTTIPWINEPSLVLTQVGNNEKFDGFLTMSEIMSLKIPSEIVMLTACSTGVGENIHGEGVMGLGRAFQYAGAKNIMMSLWPVSEDATVALTESFLKNLQNNLPAKEALRKAKLEIRKNGYEHPFYWAGFILVSK